VLQKDGSTVRRLRHDEVSRMLPDHRFA